MLKLIYLQEYCILQDTSTGGEKMNMPKNANETQQLSNSEKQQICQMQQSAHNDVLIKLSSLGHSA